MNTNPANGWMNSLPLFIYDAVRSPEHLYIVRGFGAAIVLLVLVVVLFAITRLLARDRRKTSRVRTLLRDLRPF
jgi:phosphate transport system permease protein